MFASRTGWPLTPNRLSRLLEEHRQRGLPLCDLTESNPTRCGFLFDAKAILGALAGQGSLDYAPDPRGPLAARQAVVEYYAEREVRVSPERVFLTTSTSEAYSYIFRLLANPGEDVLVPSPSYPLLDFLAKLNDVNLVSYPLAYHDGWELDLQALRQQLTPRTRAIIVIHPNNPTGSFVRARELDFLVELCQRHAAALVADEVFRDYAWAPDGERVVSHAAVGEVLTFTLSGLSKISALPQMKLAWLVVNGPENLLKDAVSRLEVIADTYLSVAPPLANALPKMLEARRAIQPQIRERVRANLAWLDDQLSGNQAVSRLRAEGGWYVILKLPTVMTDEDWAIELLREDHVFVHPGHFYDFPSEGYLVASLLPPPDVFRSGMTKLLKRVRLL